MTDRIRAGTMLLEDSTPTPEGMVVATERYSAGWSSIIKSTSAQLGRELEGAGWTFFYMAGEIRRSGFGFNDQSRTDRALAHVINAVKREHCNCLEITQMRKRYFLGLPYTNLVAHARHIQRSRWFQDPSDLLASTHPHSSEWLSNQTAAVRGKTLLTSEVAQAWENEGGSRAETNCPA
ncbi:MAG: hypothetical protein WAM39_07030 [Bryobacteraceae bacterium]